MTDVHKTNWIPATVFTVVASIIVGSSVIHRRHQPSRYLLPKDIDSVNDNGDDDDDDDIDNVDNETNEQSQPVSVAPFIWQETNVWKYNDEFVDMQPSEHEHDQQHRSDMISCVAPIPPTHPHCSNLALHVLSSEQYRCVSPCRDDEDDREENDMPAIILRSAQLPEDVYIDKVTWDRQTYTLSANVCYGLDGINDVDDNTDDHAWQIHQRIFITRKPNQDSLSDEGTAEHKPSTITKDCVIVSTEQYDIQVHFRFLQYSTDGKHWNAHLTLSKCTGESQ